MLDPHCAQRRIKLVLPIPNYFKIYFCPKLTLSLKRRSMFKIYNAVKAFMKSQLYKILHKFHNILDPTVDKEGLNLFYPSIRGISCRSLATTSVCSLSVQLNIKDKYRSPLGCLSWIRIQKYLDPTADEEGLNLSYPSIRGTSRRSWATTSACFSGDVIRRMSAELSWEMLESQIIKRVNSSATKHNKKNQCWRRNFRPEINKKAFKLSYFSG